MVMFLGRVTRQKGIVHLIDAAARIDPDAQMVLCAGAPDTPEIGAEVREKVAGLRRARGGVFWIEEMLPRSDVVQLLSHAAVFVCPSVYEPFGLINLEAMACGLPVVASAVGGIPEIVIDGETGYLVAFDAGGDVIGSPRDPERFAADLADRVNDLLADARRARDFGQAGRRRVLEHFSWRAIAARTAELYDQLVGAT
jgi:starch synthase